MSSACGSRMNSSFYHVSSLELSSRGLIGYLPPSTSLLRLMIDSFLGITAYRDFRGYDGSEGNDHNLTAPLSFND